MSIHKYIISCNKYINNCNKYINNCNKYINNCNKYINNDSNNSNNNSNNSSGKAPINKICNYTSSCSLHNIYNKKNNYFNEKEYLQSEMKEINKMIKYYNNDK
jgi:hypothetical protein